MTARLELGTAEAVLRLATNEHGWCQVALEVDGRHEILGAEAQSVILERLGRGLADDVTGKTSGEIDGHQVTWVLSLAERHCSVFVGEAAGGVRHIFFQGAEGDLIATVILSSDQRRAWLRALRGT